MKITIEDLRAAYPDRAFWDTSRARSGDMLRSGSTYKLEDGQEVVLIAFDLFTSEEYGIVKRLVYYDGSYLVFYVGNDLNDLSALRAAKEKREVRRVVKIRFRAMAYFETVVELGSSELKELEEAMLPNNRLCGGDETKESHIKFIAQEMSPELDYIDIGDTDLENMEITSVSDFPAEKMEPVKFHQFYSKSEVVEK